MNLEQYQKVTQELTEHRKGISKGKRKDYTKSSSDVLANFKNQARDLGVTELQSLGVHMEKQMSAVLNYIKTNGQSESEPIKNRIADTINYLELMWGLINDLDDERVKKTEGVSLKIPFPDENSEYKSMIKPIPLPPIEAYNNYFDEGGHVVKHFQQDIPNPSENPSDYDEEFVKAQWIEKDKQGFKTPIIGYGDSRLKEKETGQSFGMP